MVENSSSEREPMATVYLKDGKTAEVPISELENYLEANRDNIQPRTIKRRGPVRAKLPAKTNPVG